jgi:hypothetical protein
MSGEPAVGSTVVDGGIELDVLPVVVDEEDVEISRHRGRRLDDLSGKAGEGSRCPGALQGIAR